MVPQLQFICTRIVNNPQAKPRTNPLLPTSKPNHWRHGPKNETKSKIFIASPEAASGEPKCDNPEAKKNIQRQNMIAYRKLASWVAWKCLTSFCGWASQLLFDSQLELRLSWALKKIICSCALKTRSIRAIPMKLWTRIYS